MDKRTLERWEKEEVSKFSDPRFGQVDLSGCPSLQPPPLEQKFQDQDEHGLSRVDVGGKGIGSGDLKNFLSHPDASALEQIAAHNPAAAEELRDRKALEEFRAFEASHLGYYKTDQNYELMLDWLKRNRRPFDRNTLAEAYQALSRAGELEVRPGTMRTLTAAQKLEIARQAQNDLSGAIGTFVEWSLPENIAAEYDAADDTDLAKRPTRASRG